MQPLPGPPHIEADDPSSSTQDYPPPWNPAALVRTVITTRVAAIQDEAERRRDRLTDAERLAHEQEMAQYQLPSKEVAR